MSKKAIDFTQINETALVHLQNFAAARIAIAKEDQRHKAEKKSLNAQLDALHPGFSDLRDEVPINA